MAKNTYDSSQLRHTAPLLFSPEVIRVVSRSRLVRLEFLTSLFDKNYKKYFPFKIPDVNLALPLIHLSEALQSLSSSEGFLRHIEEYKNNVDSTYFVTTLAAYFQVHGYSIVLEPEDNNAGGKADICIKDSISIVDVECKYPRKDATRELLPEVRAIDRTLRKYVTRPCHLFITYQNSLDAQALEKLGEFLSKRLSAVTAEGNIYHDKDVKIDVTKLLHEFEDKDIEVSLVLENFQTKSFHPTWIINRQGVGIGYAKTGVSGISSVLKQLKNSRHKVQSDRPFLVAIQSDSFVGERQENERALASTFQPQKNTRISGVVLVRWHYSIENGIEFVFDYISNPYARIPLAAEVAHKLFHRRPELPSSGHYSYTPFEFYRESQPDIFWPDP
jgi:hypothetical protein